ncbi:MAG: outer membrane protein assembly factor BamE [Clostridiales bacterium]|nr:outer membrane protein assembly factor BamE [Clostridiales bacterium]
MPDEDRQEELRRAHKFNRIALLGLLVIFLLGVVLGVIRKGHAFSTEQWLAEPAERVKIVDDLLERYDLVGMTSEAVEALLGPPADETPFTEADTYYYYLGDERGLISIDSEWLALTFSDGVVVEAAVTTD